MQGVHSNTESRFSNINHIKLLIPRMAAQTTNIHQRADEFPMAETCLDIRSADGLVDFGKKSGST